MRVLRSEAYAQWVGSLIHGNPGNHRNLTEGVAELKIDVGPGYRVYYSPPRR